MITIQCALSPESFRCRCIGPSRPVASLETWFGRHKANKSTKYFDTLYRIIMSCLDFVVYRLYLIVDCCLGASAR
jgi:hypothetical protein